MPTHSMGERLVEIEPRLRDRGLDVDFRPELGRDRDACAALIGAYDGLAIRSTTRVTAKLLARADRLKVVGRAGIGVDKVDVAAATARGVIVMNTPFGNSITTASGSTFFFNSCANSPRGMNTPRMKPPNTA